MVANGSDAGTVLVGAGALYVAAGLYFKVPVPVQPVKAAATIAIARGLSPGTLSAAGLLLGVVLMALGTTGASRVVARVFAPPIVRGVQLSVGLMLVRASAHLAPASSPATLWIGAAIALVLFAASIRRARMPVALLVVVAGAVWSVATGAHIGWHPSLWHPHIDAVSLRPSVLWPAFTMLVIPQLPLTFGNAISALVDVERREFGAHARRVTPGAVSMSCGVANVVAGALGGMPMCHGSGGLTAHVRAGARTARMNVMIGAPLIALGMFFGRSAFDILALIPVSVLCGFLLFTGVSHGSLVADQRGYELTVALAMGIAGFWTANLAIALCAGVISLWPVRAAQRFRVPTGAAA